MWSPDKLYESDYYRSRCCKFAPWMSLAIFVATMWFWSN